MIVATTEMKTVKKWRMTGGDHFHSVREVLCEMTFVLRMGRKEGTSEKASRQKEGNCKVPPDATENKLKGLECSWGEARLHELRLERALGPGRVQHWRGW